MPALPTVSWDETSPAGSQAISLGDDRIREMKTQLREVIDVDHKFGSSGSDADNGCHDQVTLLEKADLGTGAVGKTILGSQTVSGKGELCYVDEDDTTIQLTTLGGINAAALVIASQAAGDLLVAASATAYKRFAKGTALQYLRMNAGATDVEWAADPSFTPTAANALSGSVIQVVNTQTAAQMTITAHPADSTTALESSETTLILTRTITPSNASNKLLIRVVVNGSPSGADPIMTGIFIDSATTAVAVNYAYVASGYEPLIVLEYFMTAGTTSEISFNVRLGVLANSYYLNGAGAGGAIGAGTQFSSITITEIKA